MRGYSRFIPDYCLHSWLANYPNWVAAELEEAARMLLISAVAYYLRL